CQPEHGVARGPRAHLPGAFGRLDDSWRVAEHSKPSAQLVHFVPEGGKAGRRLRDALLPQLPDLPAHPADCVDDLLRVLAWFEPGERPCVRVCERGRPAAVAGLNGEDEHVGDIARGDRGDGAQLSGENLLRFIDGGYEGRITRALRRTHRVV